MGAFRVLRDDPGDSSVDAVPSGRCSSELAELT